MSLKIYIQDHGVYGMTVVIADSELEAREMMKGEGRGEYEENKPIEEYKIEKGFVYENNGDR